MTPEMSHLTLTLSDILVTLRQHKLRLQSRYGVRRLAVFGSYARGEQGPHSDIDILVELGEKPLGLAYFSLVRDIAALFPIKTEVVSFAALKPRYLAAILEELHEV
ncbi:MAG: nucleotidyltransferase family protein [Pseudomonadota bacterium]|nr:nucleotidyltransferase family protein [Pseudomonadota bacterium]